MDKMEELARGWMLEHYAVDDRTGFSAGMAESLAAAFRKVAEEEREREIPLVEIIAEVAEMPMTTETPGVGRDEMIDEWISLARIMAARERAFEIAKTAVTAALRRGPA